MDNSNPNYNGVVLTTYDDSGKKYLLKIEAVKRFAENGDSYKFFKNAIQVLSERFHSGCTEGNLGYSYDFKFGFQEWKFVNQDEWKEIYERSKPYHIRSISSYLDTVKISYATDPNNIVIYVIETNAYKKIKNLENENERQRMKKQL